MKFSCFRNGISFFSRVNDEKSARKFLHFLNTAEVFFKFLDFKVKFNNFFLRKKIERAVLFHFAKLRKTLDTGLDSRKVGKHTAEPTGIYIVHADSLGFFLNGFLSLLFRSYEKNAVAGFSNVTNKHIRFFNLFNGLLKVYDVNAVSFGEDVFRHFGVPSSGLVSEVNTCFEQLFH